jgi:diguanylate cyclase (GGDEF)-like protein
MQNSIRQNINILSIIFCFIFSGTSFATQLVDTLPTHIEDNWRICFLYDQLKPECHEDALPLKKVKNDELVKQQTFVNNIIISSTLKKTTLAIWLDNVDDVDEIYFNQHLIGKTGQFLPNFESGFRSQRLYIIPSELITYNHINTIKVITFSSRSLPGIQMNSPVIGEYIKLQNILKKQDYSFVIVSSILLLLAIFQVFYFITVKDKKENLYCAIFFLAFSIISILRSFLPLDLELNLSSVFKLESFMLNAGVISVSLFIFNFFELEVRRLFSNSLLIIGASGLFVLIWPYAINLRLIAEINYWIVCIIGGVVVGSALIVSIGKQRHYIHIIGFTITIGWLFLVYDAMMQSAGLFQLQLDIHKSILPIYSAITGIIFTLTITHKLWKSFKGATYDHLTGTLLRPAFFQRLSEEMQRCQRGDANLLVAIIDIQQVRDISVNFGYSIGNQLLMTVSNSLTKVLRPFDLICRISDEQFCIAASVHSQEDSESCLRRVYEELIEIQQPIENDVQLFIDTRVGGVIYNQEQHLSVSQLLQDANYALAKAKNQAAHNYLLIQNPAIPL